MHRLRRKRVHRLDGGFRTVGIRRRRKQKVQKDGGGDHRRSAVGSRQLRPYCSKRMFRRSPLLIRTMQSFSWKRPCCSALPPLSRRLTSRPRVLQRSNHRVNRTPEKLDNMAAELQPGERVTCAQLGPSLRTGTQVLT